MIKSVNFKFLKRHLKALCMYQLNYKTLRSCQLDTVIKLKLIDWLNDNHRRERACFSCVIVNTGAIKWIIYEQKTVFMKCRELGYSLKIRTVLDICSCGPCLTENNRGIAQEVHFVKMLCTGKGFIVTFTYVGMYYYPRPLRFCDVHNTYICITLYHITWTFITQNIRIFLNLSLAWLLMLVFDVNRAGALAVDFVDEPCKLDGRVAPCMDLLEPEAMSLGLEGFW